MVDTLSPGAVAGNGIMPITAAASTARRWSILISMTWRRASALRTPSRRTPPFAAASAQAMFITRAPAPATSSPSTLRRRSSPRCRQSRAKPTRLRARQDRTSTSCFATRRPGLPLHRWSPPSIPPPTTSPGSPRIRRDSYVESYFLSVQQQLCQEHPARHCLRGQPRPEAAGLPQRQPEEPGQRLRPSIRNWPATSPRRSTSFSNYNALQVRYEQRYCRGLTLLNSFTWEHSLDNDSASLEGNTPSPQDANNLHAEYAQSDYNLPIANVTSLVYDLPFGQRPPLYGSRRSPERVSADGRSAPSITLQAGIPFNLVYTPSYAQVSPLSAQPIAARTSIVPTAFPVRS